MLQTMLSLAMVTAVGVLIALAWCVAFALVGYLWSRKLYNRDPIR